MWALRRFLRRLIGNENDEKEYQCRRCDTEFDRQRQVCPVCDGFRIERSEW